MRPKTTFHSKSSITWQQDFIIETACVLESINLPHVLYTLKILFIMISNCPSVNNLKGDGFTLTVFTKFLHKRSLWVLSISLVVMAESLPVVYTMGMYSRLSYDFKISITIRLLLVFFNQLHIFISPTCTLLAFSDNLSILVMLRSSNTVKIECFLSR